MSRKPENWYGMSYDEQRSWEKAERAREDIEYERDRAREDAERSDRRAREKETYARQLRCERDQTIEEAGQLQDEIDILVEENCKQVVREKELRTELALVAEYLLSIDHVHQFAEWKRLAAEAASPNPPTSADTIDLDPGE